MSKVCKICKRLLPIAEFYRNRDTRLARCRDCISDAGRTAYRDNPSKRATAVFTCLLQRIGNTDGKNPSYANVRLMFTRSEFLEWYVAAYADFRKIHGDAKPSVDRIHDGDYRLDDMQLIPIGENSRKAPGNRNVHAPPGIAWCAKCRKYYNRVEFHKSKSQPHGLVNCCKNCERKRKKLERKRKRCISP